MPTSTIVWIAALLAMALVVPLGLFAARRVPRRRRQVDDLPTQWPLVSRPVFGGAERRLYRMLVEALPHHVILAKLPLVRMCQPADPDPAQVRHWFRLLGGTHVSFAVCDAHGRVLATVDLISARARPSQRTQRIKTAVLHACQVRYLTCSPDALPSLPTLRALAPQPFADAASAAVVHGPHPLSQSQPPPAPAGAARAAGAAGAAEFDDSFFQSPGDSVLGELSTLTSTDTSRAHH